MANQKTALYKVLVVVLVFLCWFQSSGRVEAAPYENTLWERDYKYYASGYSNGFTGNSYRKINKFSYSSPDLKKLNKLIFTDQAGNYHYVLWSYELIDVYGNNYEHTENVSGKVTVNTNKDINFTNGNYGGTFLLSNSVRVYYYHYGGVSVSNDSDKVKSNTYLFADFYDIKINNPEPALRKILENSIVPDDPYYGDYVPDWSESEYDQLLKIENFKASIEDDTLKMTWNPVDYPSGEREFHYIKFRFKQRLPGIQESGNRRAYVAKEFYIQYKELSGSVPISDLGLTDGYILSSLQATPYYHLSDNPEFPLKHGDTTYVYFDDDGNSSNPILIDTAVDPDVNEEEVPRTILGTIQNFFSNFWRNITNTAKAAVVPEQDELLGLLGEMNDWFSERFGFIWYPFDLAIDIVAAFGLGEPNTKLTVPALTLNMMGGIQLWESFEIDLDPVDFLKYVRFFTSVLMCCGTVSLAIRKWEEWIGGKNQ